MGLIGSLMGTPAATQAIGATVKNVAEVFLPNATRKMELSAEAYQAAISEQSEEFRSAASGMFDRFVNGLNRMPRPMLAFGTLGLFTYAMVDPAGFAPRMQGLAAVPEPLWWLLGAIVSFYFGAREAYYFRERGGIPPRPAVPKVPPSDTATPDAEANPALEDWRAAARD